MLCLFSVCLYTALFFLGLLNRHHYTNTGRCHTQSFRWWWWCELPILNYCCVNNKNCCCCCCTRETKADTEQAKTTVHWVCVCVCVSVYEVSEWKKKRLTSHRHRQQQQHNHSTVSKLSKHCIAAFAAAVDNKWEREREREREERRHKSAVAVDD